MKIVILLFFPEARAFKAVSETNVCEKIFYRERYISNKFG